jgi:hypothetical protein
MFLLTKDMIIYEENLMESTEKLLEIMSLKRSQNVKPMYKNKSNFHIQ